MIDDIRRPQTGGSDDEPGKINPEVFSPHKAPEEPIETVAFDNSEPDKPAEQTEDSDTPSEDKKPDKKPHKKIWKDWTKKQRIIALVVTGIILIGGSVVAWQLLKGSSASPGTSKKQTTKKPPAAVKYYSNLSGLEISDASINDRPVTGVMIENSLDARPQSGLDQAGVVYEAIAEGGITRFLALYQDQEPSYVGPVRSARPYYMQWLRGYDANYAHVGGSPEALQDIKNWGIKDLDQFYNASAYQRVSSRYAPHNVYTSIATLRELGASKGYTSSTFTGFERKSDAASKQPTATKIDLQVSAGADFNVHYDYNAATNSYLRSEGGRPHTDEKTGAQLAPKNVIALITDYSIESDGVHSQYKVIGSGPLYVFMDGITVQGTWQKDSLEGPLTLKDQAGNPIKLNRGQTWITALAASNRVSFTP